MTDELNSQTDMFIVLIVLYWKSQKLCKYSVSFVSDILYCMKIVMVLILRICPPVLFLSMWTLTYLPDAMFLVSVCRCYSALGNIAKARYLKETVRIAEEVEKQVVSHLE